MKTILTALLYLTLTTTSFTQNKSETIEHMIFRGVPIDGTLNEYVSKITNNGFVLITTDGGVAMLKGDFAAYKDCIIGVSTLKGKNLVSNITVIFPEHDTWSALAYNYYNLKELLTVKYGEPSKVIEKFDTYSEPNDDNSKMYALEMNNCKYYATYETKNGSIQLSIENDGFSKSFVRLSYFDKINSNIIREKAIDDL